MDAAFVNLVISNLHPYDISAILNENMGSWSDAVIGYCGKLHRLNDF